MYVYIIITVIIVSLFILFVGLTCFGARQYICIYIFFFIYHFQQLK